jgi:hypothetical protein
MPVFAIGIEHALDVSVKRSHNADPGEHRRAVTSDEHQGLHRILPFRRGVLGFNSLLPVANADLLH